MVETRLGVLHLSYGRGVGYEFEDNSRATPHNWWIMRRGLGMASGLLLPWLTAVLR